MIFQIFLSNIIHSLKYQRSTCLIIRKPNFVTNMKFFSRLTYIWNTCSLHFRLHLHFHWYFHFYFHKNLFPCSCWPLILWSYSDVFLWPPGFVFLVSGFLVSGFLVSDFLVSDFLVFGLLVSDFLVSGFLVPSCNLQGVPINMGIQWRIRYRLFK